MTLIPYQVARSRVPRLRGLAACPVRFWQHLQPGRRSSLACELREVPPTDQAIRGDGPRLLPRNMALTPGLAGSPEDAYKPGKAGQPS
jgi:hypothetical protein